MTECGSRQQDRLALSNGMNKAGALLEEFGYHGALMSPQRVDVFDCIARAGAKLGFESLDARLLGAYVKLPGFSGIILNSNNSWGIQRFVAAHELGHFALGHATHFDYETILLRGPIADGRVSRFVSSEEREADAFASHFILPKCIIMSNMEAQDWDPSSLAQPEIAYQASLRLGAGFMSAIYGLEREKIIDSKARVELLKVDLCALKRTLLDGHDIPNMRKSEVWLLTEKDEGAVIEADREDLFLLKLKESTGAGYLWNFDELDETGFVILKDRRDPVSKGMVGSHTIRNVLLRANNPEMIMNTLELMHSRPWDPEDGPRRLTMNIKITTGGELGLFISRRGRSTAA